MVFNMAGGGKFKLKLLWENASAASTFAEQTIQVEGLSKYRYLVVEAENGVFLLATGTTTTQSMQTTDIDTDDCSFYVRRVGVNATENTVSFRNGFVANVFYLNKPVTSNDTIIPRYIYGLYEKGED